MAFTVEQLIEGHQKPVTISPNSTAQQALELMIENDFGQLPVVDENNKPLGIVTSDSILRALNNFEVSLKELQTSHAILRVKQYRPEEDLFDFLDDLKSTYAVLIVDSEGTLMGIVTGFDANEYFRRRAEDMMYVEDIESMLKDFINIAFNGTDEIAQNALAAAITEITDADLRKKFQGAVNHYLNRTVGNKAILDQEILEEVFIKHFSSKDSTKSFDDLALHDYIQLMLHKSKWSSFTSVFRLKADAIRNLLNAVRETRNALAHFHGEISSKQRDQLHFCAEWLERHRPKVAQAFSPKAVQQAEDVIAATLEYPITGNPLTTMANTVNELAISSSSNLENTSLENSPLPEMLGSDNSRYAPLAIWLERLEHPTSVKLSFREIEDIIGDNLPPSARKHRSWWANSLSSPQGRLLWYAGWQVSYVDMYMEVVRFYSLNKGKDYREFYQILLTQLSQQAPFAVRIPPRLDKRWVMIANLPTDGPSIATLGFSFSLSWEFRVELYIDTGKELVNKGIFDGLYLQKKVIEAEMGRSLRWERLKRDQASRIVLSRADGISNEEVDKEYHDDLRNWALEGMLRLQRVMEKHISEVYKQLQL